VPKWQQKNEKKKEIIENVGAEAVATLAKWQDRSGSSWQLVGSRQKGRKGD